MNTIRTRKRFDIINYMPYILGVIAVTVVIVLICVFSAGGIESIKKSKLMLLPFKATSTYTPFAGGAVYIDKEKSEVYYVDDRNETMWGFSGAVEGMKLYAGESKVGITVGKKLQIIDKDGNFVFSKEFDKNISAVTVSDRIIAVSLSHSDDTIILNGTGEEIDRIVSNVNGTNIRFGTFDKNSVWVISVENSGYKPEYQLSTYKYETEKTQTVTFTDDSQMMYNVVFDNKICYIFGTDKIMVRDCDYTGSVNKDYTVNGCDVVSWGKIKKTTHILLSSNGNFKAIGENGLINLTCEEKLNFGAVSSKSYLGFSQYFMYRFKPKNGKYTKYRFPVRVDKIVNGDGYVLIESGENVYRYGLEV